MSYTPEQRRTWRQKRYADGWPAKRMTPATRAYVMWWTARRNAKVAGYEFSIDKSDIVIPKTCPILGIPLVCDGAARVDGLPSLDRFDSSKGYVKGNVWVISWAANRMKSKWALEQFRSLVRAMDAHAPKLFRAKAHAFLTREAA